MTESTGKVFGATLLVTGCCIGAAMLGLPLLTALGGFTPTLLLFTLCWLFMATTGLLLLEVNLSFKEEVNIVTMATRTLGTFGKIASWGLFTFLFYSIMVAYVSGIGQLLADFVEESLHVVIPEWSGALGVCAFFSLLLAMGTGTVDRCNRLLMVGLITSYCVLVVLGGAHVNLTNLSHVDWSASLLAIPAMIISFGYHNLIPSLTTYLNRDVKKIRFAIIVGSLIPLVVYLLWEWVILGLVPVEGEGGFREALGQGDLATRALRRAVGASWIVNLAEYFAFFSVITSLLSVALSFVDFLSDGLHIKKKGTGTPFLVALTLTPPFVCSLLYPKIFLVALSYAGAFGAVLLFGVLPVLMVWLGREKKQAEWPTLVPGGKGTLISIFLFSLAVVTLELIH